jgi:TPR repeat protein
MRQLVIIVALIFAHAAWSGDFEGGWDAFQRKDYATAFTKFRSSAEQGDIRSQNLLGIMYENGLGVAQDYKEAIRWYQFAAQQGDPIAQYNLGVMYLNGQGVLQDYVRAHMWFNITAIAGDKESVKNRDKAASKMSPQQVEQAQRMARVCMASNFTKCD